MNISPEIKVEMNEREKEQRKVSDESYAIKLVEKIVFSGVALVLVGVVSALIALITKRIQ